jgi:hypothetical protein
VAASAAFSFAEEMMAELNNSGSGQWSETDASNASVPPDGWPAGMLPNQVEPAARAMMGAIKRFWNRINGTVQSSGSAGAYVYTPVNAGFPTAYVEGETYQFRANFTSIGNDTLNINGLGARPLYKPTASGPARIGAGDIQNGQKVLVSYDATLNGGGGGFHVLCGVAGGFAGGTLTSALIMSGAAIDEAQASLASAATVSIGAAAANSIVITGMTAITGFDSVQAGTLRRLQFQGSLALTYNATSLILPGAASIVTAPGDEAIFESQGGGVWKCLAYTRANGLPVLRDLGIVVVQDRKPSGTNGTALTQNAWTDRDLQTITLNTVPSGVSVSSPNLTLPAGTYDVDIQIVGTAATTGGAFKSRLYNLSSLAVQQDINGNDIVSSNSGVPAGSFTGVLMCITARLTLTVATQLKIQTYATISGSTSGFAVGSGEPEIYLNAKFVKVA